MNFCLGTVQFGTQYGVQGNGRPDYDAVSGMLQLAISSGINCFDTAAAYGDAENVLGRFRGENSADAEKMRIISKLDPKAFENVERSSWGEFAVAAARESLERVRADRLFAYLFHNASYIFDAEAVTALCRVKDAGLAERIGVSIYTPEEALKALEYPEISAIQIPYNVFDHRLDRAGFFEKAMKRSVTVFARSSLLQGLAVMEPDKLPKHMRFAKPYLETLRSICSAYGVSPLQAAIGYAGQHPGVDYVVFGVDNKAQLEEYLALRDTRLPSKMFDALRTAFSEAEERLVNPTLWKS